VSYAIFRVAPIKTLGDLGQIGAHNQRKKEAYQSNPDIDKSKSHNNIEVVPLSEKYLKGFIILLKTIKQQHNKRQETIRDERKKSFSKMVDDSKSVVADELLLCKQHITKFHNVILVAFLFVIQLHKKQKRLILSH